MTRAIVIDLEMGNVCSLVSALTFLGVDHLVTDRAESLLEGSHIILPGVGAYDAAMQKLTDRALVGSIRDCVLNQGMPILGICLGMQLLCSSSEEGALPGLQLIEGKCERLRPSLESGYKVPHVGFSKVCGYQPEGLFKDLGGSAFFYFTHSYALHAIQDGRVNAAYCEHTGAFVAAFQMGLISAVQFHPEKSQSSGLRLLRNFLEKAERA